MPDPFAPAEHVRSPEMEASSRTATHRWHAAKQWAAHAGRALVHALVRVPVNILIADWYSIGSERPTKIRCAKVGCTFEATSGEIICPRDNWLLRAAAGGWRVRRHHLVQHSPATDETRKTKVQRLRDWYAHGSLYPGMRYRQTKIDVLAPRLLLIASGILIVLSLSFDVGAIVIKALLLVALTLVAAETTWRHSALNAVVRSAATVTGVLVVLVFTYSPGRTILWPWVAWTLLPLLLVASLAHFWVTQQQKVLRGHRNGAIAPGYPYEPAHTHFMALLALISSAIVAVLTLAFDKNRLLWFVVSLPTVYVFASIVLREGATSFVGREEPVSRGNQRDARGDNDQASSNLKPHLRDSDLETFIGTTSRRIALLALEVGQGLRLTVQTVTIPLGALYFGQVLTLQAGEYLASHLCAGARDSQACAGQDAALLPGVALITFSVLLMATGISLAAEGRNAPHLVKNLFLAVGMKSWAMALFILLVATVITVKNLILSVDGPGAWGQTSWMILGALASFLVIRSLRRMVYDRATERRRDAPTGN